MNIAVVALCKDEERYILEWLSYYIQLGVTHFYLFDNNDLNNNRLADVVRTKYTNEVVTIIDARGRDGLHKYGMQRGCYTYVYNNFGYMYDIIGFFDIDEFLYLNGLGIPEFMSDPRFVNTDVVQFNWRYYGDNDLVTYDDRPVQERFSLPCEDNVKYAQTYPENTWVKSLVRPHKRLIMCYNHTFQLENGICKHCNGSLSDSTNMHHDIDFSGGYVKHYGTKTITEYIERKCWNTSQIFDDTKFSATLRLQWFFNVNRHTPVKDAIANWFISRGL